MPQDGSAIATVAVAGKKGKSRRQHRRIRESAGGQAKLCGVSIAGDADAPNDHSAEATTCGGDNADATPGLMAGPAKAAEATRIGHDGDRLVTRASEAMNGGDDPDRLVPGPVTVQLKGLGRSIILMREPALLDYPKDAISTLDGFSTSAGIIVVIAHDANNVRRRCEEIRGKVKRGECAMGRDAGGRTLNIIGFDVSSVTAMSLQHFID